MNTPKTAPDPQIGSNPELLALCLAHIDTEAELRAEIRDMERIIITQRALLIGIEDSLKWLAYQSSGARCEPLHFELLALAKRITDGIPGR